MEKQCVEKMNAWVKYDRYLFVIFFAWVAKVYILNCFSEFDFSEQKTKH